MLDKIISTKQEEVLLGKNEEPVSVLETFANYTTPRVKLRPNQQGLIGIIAEFKRKSPSRGNFPSNLVLEHTLRVYQESGMSALSVLTDQDFFSGSLKDLEQAKSISSLPVLRKDFIIDPYQIHQARAYGADIVLLIVRCLTPQKLKKLSQLAKSLELQVLLEVHQAEELKLALEIECDFLGINCRDLDQGKTKYSHFENILDQCPNEIDWLRKSARPLIAESGITQAQQLTELIQLGYSGFLLGTVFLNSESLVDSCRQFTAVISNLEGPK